jgi:hypothetical protein
MDKLEKRGAEEDALKVLNELKKKFEELDQWKRKREEEEEKIKKMKAKEEGENGN